MITKFLPIQSLASHYIWRLGPVYQFIYSQYILHFLFISICSHMTPFEKLSTHVHAVGKKRRQFSRVLQEFPHNRQSFSNNLKCQHHCKRHLWLMQTYWTQSTAAAWSFYWMTDVFLGVCLRTFCFLSSPASCFLRDSLALHPKGHCYWSVNHRKTFLPGCPLQSARGPSGNNYNCCLQGGHRL